MYSTSNVPPRRSTSIRSWLVSAAVPSKRRSTAQNNCSNAIDSSVTADSIHALNRSTAYMQMFSGNVFSMMARTGFMGLGSVEISADTGTPIIAVNLGTFFDGSFSGGGGDVPVYS